MENTKKKKTKERYLREYTFDSGGQRANTVEDQRGKSSWVVFGPEATEIIAAEPQLKEGAINTNVTGGNRQKKGGSNR